MKLSVISVFSAFLCIPPVLAQTTTPAQPQLSPKAAYANALQPLQSTRALVANWSDAEIAALKVSITHAAEECHARPAENFDGDPLIDLARLCALGQAWGPVVQSTTRYIQSEGNPKPLLGEAYAAQIDANLHLKDKDAALTGAHALLTVAPYNALTAEAIDEVITYMQFAFTPDAIAIAELRQPLVLARLKAPASADSQANANEPAPQSLHELYDDALMLASLQQLAGKLDAARNTLVQVDAALPSSLSPDDLLPITASRRRYSLLGRSLPQFKPTLYLRQPDSPPQIPAPNAITALVLFPDWCAQCVRMGRAFPQTVFTVAGHEAYLYGLLDETVPPHKTLSTDTFNPADSSLLLQQTSTLVIPNADFDQFAVNGFPFLVITDAHGIVRVAQLIDPNALHPGDTVDTAIACVGDHWQLRRTPIQRTASRTQHAPAAPPAHPPASSLH